MSESDIFEIEDYTTASPLEKFVALLEDQIRQWGLDTSSKISPNISKKIFLELDFRTQSLEAQR